MTSCGINRVSLSINIQSSAAATETKSTEAVVPVTAASQVRNCLFLIIYLSLY